MGKKGPMNKIEAFYVENNYLNIEIDQIALDLDRSKTSVENYIKKHVKPKKTTGTTTTNNGTVGEQLARRPGVVTMTENASTMSDSVRRNRKPTKSKTRVCTTKIKNDE